MPHVSPPFVIIALRQKKHYEENMSTSLKKIKTSYQSSKTDNTAISLTVFYGVQNNGDAGRSVQITLHNSKSISEYTAIDIQGVFELRNQLNAVLDGNYKKFDRDLQG